MLIILNCYYRINWLLDRIPGGVIGALARYNLTDVLNVAVNMATVLVLIPKMTPLFMESLMPISEGAKNLTKKRLKGRELYGIT